MRYSWRCPYCDDGGEYDSWEQALAESYEHETTELVVA